MSSGRNKNKRILLEMQAAVYILEVMQGRVI